MPKWAFTLINGIFLALCKCGENFGVFFLSKNGKYTLHSVRKVLSYSCKVYFTFEGVI